MNLKPACSEKLFSREDGEIEFWVKNIKTREIKKFRIIGALGGYFWIETKKLEEK
jgi:hypothetical protein